MDGWMDGLLVVLSVYFELLWDMMWDEEDVGFVSGWMDVCTYGMLMLKLRGYDDEVDVWLWIVFYRIWDQGANTRER